MWVLNVSLVLSTIHIHSHLPWPWPYLYSFICSFNKYVLSSHRQSANKWAWLHSNKTACMSIEIQYTFHISQNKHLFFQLHGHCKYSLSIYCEVSTGIQGWTAGLWPSTEGQCWTDISCVWSLIQRSVMPYCCTSQDCKSWSEASMKAYLQK